MTLENLLKNYQGYDFLGRGHYRVKFIIRNKMRSAVTTNTTAIDRINNDEVSDKTERYGYTLKQALQTLYKEVKRANGLV